MRTIQEIDKDINANRKAIMSAQSIRNPLRAVDWQDAWDREPALAARDKCLFAERGEAQLERDRRDYERAMAERRSIPRGRLCPACNGTGRAA